MDRQRKKSLDAWDSNTCGCDGFDAGVNENHISGMVQALRVAEVRLSTLFRRIVCIRVLLGISKHRSMWRADSADCDYSQQYRNYIAAGHIHCICDLSRPYRSNSQHLESVYSYVSCLASGRSNEHTPKNHTGFKLCTCLLRQVTDFLAIRCSKRSPITPSQTSRANRKKPTISGHRDG
ncbi:hypothetical protein CJF30_00006790 [Rutstroemia sp. NJR-2017a BBW]|nr:hypothetical protein CJF30_00006790 [Rutstroemia sp. NJR-2017a BBW]